MIRSYNLPILRRAAWWHGYNVRNTLLLFTLVIAILFLGSLLDELILVRTISTETVALNRRRAVCCPKQLYFPEWNFRRTHMKTTGHEFAKIIEQRPHSERLTPNEYITLTNLQSCIKRSVWNHLLSSVTTTEHIRAACVGSCTFADNHPLYTSTITSNGQEMKQLSPWYCMRIHDFGNTPVLKQTFADVAHRHISATHEIHLYECS